MLQLWTREEEEEPNMGEALRGRNLGVVVRRQGLISA